MQLILKQGYIGCGNKNMENYTEIQILRDRLDFIARQERSCCPEHVGFSEYIANITTALAQRDAEIAECDQDRNRLVRELDVLWNGEEGAAKQASLCDVVAQIARELPLLRAQLDEANKALTHYARRYDKNGKCWNWILSVCDSYSGEAYHFDWHGDEQDEAWEIAEKAIDAAKSQASTARSEPEQERKV